MPFGQDSSGRSARRSMGFLVALFVLVCGLFMAIGAYFAYDTLLKAERQAVESRFALATQRVAVSAERGASYGVALAAQTTLSEVLAREAHQRATQTHQIGQVDFGHGRRGNRVG